MTTYGADPGRLDARSSPHEDAGTSGADLGWALLFTDPGLLQPPRSSLADVATRLLSTVIRRSPPAALLVIDEPEDACTIAGELAIAVGGLPAAHPRHATPVLLVDIRSDTACPSPSPTEAFEAVEGPVILGLRIDRHAADEHEPLNPILDSAARRQIPVFLAITVRQWHRLNPRRRALLASPLHQVTINGTAARTPTSLRERLRRESESLERFHHVQFDPAAIDRAMEPSEADDDTFDGLTGDPFDDVFPQPMKPIQPELGVLRLETATARALLENRSQVLGADVPNDPLRPEPTPAQGSGGHDSPSHVPRRIAGELGSRIVGQEAALRRFEERVDIALGGLLQRPDRPKMMVMLPGPAGVGKTETAIEFCEWLTGSATNLIRIDCAGITDIYQVAMLYGSPPGYSGSTDPERWITTRVRRRPNTVLLLDEIEKAHWQFFTVFLMELLGRGTLTDYQGITVDATGLYVVMTTNIGSELFRPSSTGFLTSHTSISAETAVRRLVEERLPAEVYSRLDDVIVYQPLEPSALEEILDKALGRFTNQAAAAGYRVTITPQARALILDHGSSPAYGVRFLHRAIEALLASRLSALPQGRYKAIATHSGTIEMLMI